MSIEVLRIVKNYTHGDEESGGYYKFKVFQDKIEEKDLDSYEISCPLYRNKYIYLGVNSLLHEYSLNEVAMELLNYLVFGDCILFCDNVEQSFDQFSLDVKNDLIRKGFQMDMFNY